VKAIKVSKALAFRSVALPLRETISKGVSSVRFLSRTLLVLLAIAQFVTLAIAFQKPAYAYADPGSGLLFLQVAGSMAAGALFILRSKLRKLFHWSKSRAEETAVEQAQDVQQ
jgi:hypothetical protein